MSSRLPLGCTDLNAYKLLERQAVDALEPTSVRKVDQHGHIGMQGCGDAWTQGSKIDTDMTTWGLKEESDAREEARGVGGDCPSPRKNAEALDPRQCHGKIPSLERRKAEGLKKVLAKLLQRRRKALDEWISSLLPRTAPQLKGALSHLQMPL